MKLSTIAATILLFSEGAYASHQEIATRRMRSVKIYSSTPQRNADLSKDIVDPYIGLPDEREQRGLKQNKPTAESVPEPTLEMSMPSGGSLPDQQSLSYPLQQDPSITTENDTPILRRRLGKGKDPKPSSAPTLEMSMPAGASLSFSYLQQLQDSTLGEGAGAGLPHRRVSEEDIYNGARITGHSSVVVAGAAIASLIAAVALM